jgi:hypothetical protein
MAYFDPNKDTVLIVDASPVGLAALLTQDNKITAYASRSLTDVEFRYSQTEKEGLAIVWSIEHVHLYLYGHKFTLVSDHQPLETIFNNPKSKIPARIERWRLRLQQYNFNVKYKPGKSNAADYMSRHPYMKSTMFKHAEIAEHYVHYISENAVPKAMTIQEIDDSTSKDANTEHRSWKQEIHTFLRNYRATPHGTTDLLPAELLFGRKINTKLPNLTNKTNNDNNVRVNDTKRKQKMKEYFELKRNTKPADLKVGDNVLVKREKKNKLSTPFNPEPMTIKNKKGNMITAAAENKEITRNLSFFKMIGKPVLCDDEIYDILESGKSNETPNTRDVFKKAKNTWLSKGFCVCILNYLSSVTGIIILCSNYFSVIERLDICL